MNRNDRNWFDNSSRCLPGSLRDRSNRSLLTGLVLFFAAAPPSLAADGDFVPSFNGGEPRLILLSGADFVPVDLVGLPNGNIRVVGWSDLQTGDDDDIFLNDLTPTGDFTNSEFIPMALGNGDDERPGSIHALDVDSYVVGGWASTSVPNKPRQGLLLVVDEVNELDPSFSGDGRDLRPANEPDGGTDGRAEIVGAIRTFDGAIVSYGRHDPGTQDDWLAKAWRQLGDTVWPAYGAGVSSFGGTRLVGAAAVSGATVVVAGNATAAGGGRPFLARLTGVNGVVDPAFGAGGAAWATLASENAVATAFAKLPDGRFVLGGYRIVSPGTIFTAAVTTAALWRYTAEGLLDPSFGEDGRVELDLGTPGGRNVINDLAVQADGRIVVAGFTGGVAFTSNVDAALARLQPGGVLDPTFGNAGRLRLALDSTAEGSDVAVGVALHPASRISVVASTEGATNTGMAVMQLTNHERAFRDGFESGNVGAWFAASN